MDEQNQIIKICCVCGHEREYDTYHRLYVACKKCASIRCANYCQKNSEKILEGSRLYRENKDRYKRNRKTIDTHTVDIQNVYNQINMLTELMKTTVSVSYLYSYTCNQT